MTAFVCQWQCSCRAHDSVHRERRACSDGQLGVYVPFHHTARRIWISVACGSYQGIFAPMFEGLLRKKGKYRFSSPWQPQSQLYSLSSCVVVGSFVGGLWRVSLQCWWSWPLRLCAFVVVFTNLPRLLWLVQWGPPCPEPECQWSWYGTLGMNV